MADPVIKHNVNARYATDDTGAALFIRGVCEAAVVPYQQYSHRGDLPAARPSGRSRLPRSASTRSTSAWPSCRCTRPASSWRPSDVEAMERSFTGWFTIAALTLVA